ncbi:11424_t:CDS:2, partial [Racocetra persica]
LQPVQELPIHEEGFLDLDVETAKNMFKVDRAEYAFSTWFTEAKEIDLASIILGAENEDEAMQRAFKNKDEAIQRLFLQCLYCNYSEKEINETIKLAVNKGYKNWLRYVKVQIESKKIEAGITKERAQRILNTIDNYEYLIKVKFIRDDTVISVEKTKKGFKIIDKYEPIRELKKAGGKYVRGGPNVILTKKMKPGFWLGIDKKFLVREVSIQSDVERLDNEVFNCVAQRVIEHFDNTKRGYGLTEIRRQKINDWEKKIHIPGARVQDVAELEKILKRPIKLLDITHGTIFNSRKYRSGKYEEIGMEAINNALRRSQAIWLMGVGDMSQTISQFVLEDGRTFRTWKKYTEIIEACKQLFLKVVDLAEQNAPDYHVNDVVCIDIKECYPASMRGQEEYTPWFNRFRHLSHYLVRVVVNGELPEDDITEFAQ